MNAWQRVASKANFVPPLMVWLQILLIHWCVFRIIPGLRPRFCKHIGRWCNLTHAWSSVATVVRCKLSVCNRKTFTLVQLGAELVSLCAGIPVLGFQSCSKEPAALRDAQSECEVLGPSQVIVWRRRKPPYAGRLSVPAFGTELFPAYPYSIQLVSKFLNCMFLRMKNLNVFMARLWYSICCSCWKMLYFS